MIPMDLGQKLLISLVLTKDVLEFYGAKLHEKYFINDSEKELYTFIINHAKEYGVLPDISTLGEEFSNIPLSPPEPYGFYLKHIEERYAVRLFRDTLAECAKLSKEKDVNAIVSTFEKSIVEYRGSENRQVVMDFGKEAHDRYKFLHAKSFIDSESLSTGWPGIDALTHGMRGGDVFSVVGRPACCAGTTEIWVSRKKDSSGRVYTLKQLYERFNGGAIPSGKGGRKTLYWDLSIPTRINSLKAEGLTGLNEVQAVVYSGKKELYEVTTSKGNSIKTTLDHRFLTPTGYKELRDISAGDTVICRQKKVKKVGKYASRSTPELTTKLPYSPYRTKIVTGILYHRVPKCRLVYDAFLNGVHPDHFVEQLKTNPTHGFIFSDSSKEIHHIDGNYLNNDISNLRLLTSKEHHALHHSQGNQRKKFGVYEVEPFEVTSIKYVGIEDTYDISMADPYNNFVAHEFVLHNSGKAQPIDAKLLTLNGFISMGEAEVGMPLASIDGEPSIISGVYPQGIKQTYKVRLIDGRETECCEEHLWAVFTPYGSAIKVLDTKFLMHCDNLSEYYIPICTQNKLDTVYIESITPSRQVECQCIRVSHPSHLYITDDYIVTHNTFLSLWVAYNNYLYAKKNVLFISMEMSRDILTYRMSAVLTKADMNEILNGTISTYKYNSILDTLKGLDELPQKLYFVDGGLKTTVDEVQSLIQQYLPDLVVIDGAYLLQHPNEKINRYEKVAVNLERLKQLAEKYRIPMFLSYQFNRKAAEKKAKGETAGMEDIGYCLRGDQIISTTQGLMTIEDAYKLGSVTTFDGVDTKYSKVIDSGKKIECVVTFEDGTELVCSPDHKVWVSTRGSNFHWVRAEELRVDDIGLTSIKPTEYSTDNGLPLEIAELLGIIIGNCDCSRDYCAISFTRDYEDLLNRLDSILVSQYCYFGCFDYPDDVDDLSKSLILDKDFVRHLNDLGVQRAGKDKVAIPSIILRGSIAIRGSFLKGLFESLGEFNNIGLHLNTVSSILAQNVQVVLKSLGIPSYVSSRNNVFSVLVYKDYLPLFSKYVGFISLKKKRLLLEQLSKMTSYDLGDYSNPLGYLKVIKVQVKGYLVSMYDVAQTDGKHQFLAQGVLVHNSDVIPQISSVILALKQPESAETLKQRELTVIKGRSGGDGTMVKIKWDFNKVDFSQIGYDNDEGDDDTDDSHKYAKPINEDDEFSD